MELFSSSSKMPILTQKVCNKHFTRCPKLIYSSKKQFLLDYQTRTKHLPPYIKRRYANFEKQSKELASWERERIVEEARNNNLFFFFLRNLGITIKLVIILVFTVPKFGTLAKLPLCGPLFVPTSNIIFLGGP